MTLKSECSDCWDAIALDLIESFKVTTEKCHLGGDEISKTGLEIFTCDDCENVGMDEVDGFMFCAACGSTKSSIMDFSGEWRVFGTNRPDTSRCGMPINPLLPNCNMSTVLVGGNNTYIKKLYKWGSMNHKDIAKYKVFVFIQDQASRVGISAAVINQAQKFAVQICDRMTATDNVLRGKNRRGLIAACLHFSFKKLGCPRAVREIANILNITPSHVTNGINLFSEMFMDKSIIVEDQTTTAEDLAPRYCNQLRLSARMTELVLEIAKKAMELDLFPTNVVEARTAACIMYVIGQSSASNANIASDKKRVSQVCGISQATIMKCCRKLEETFQTHEKPKKAKKGQCIKTASLKVTK